MTTRPAGSAREGVAAVRGDRDAVVRPAGPQARWVYSVRLSRQAVYDSSRRVQAYQLIVRGGASGEDDWPAGDHGEQATSRLIAASFGTFDLDSIADGRPVFVNFTRAFLTGVLPLPVAADNVIIEVTDQLGVDHELLLGLAELKRAGYRLAVDNYQGDPSRSALIELADFVKIDVSSVPPLMLLGLVQSCRVTGATLVATGVADSASLPRWAEQGFELFQGELLNRPATVQTRALSPSQLICVRLLGDLSDPDASMAGVADLVGSDPGLSMRLLRSANSASRSGHRVVSLRQALTLIGPRLLRSWVVLALLDGTASQTSSDDLWSVLARAHACQRLVPEQGDLAYTVGLLSGAAELLGIEPVSVADSSGVGAEARAALLDGVGPVGEALGAVRSHERNDDEAVAAGGFDPAEVSRLYLEALQEALRRVHEFLDR